MHNLLLKIKSKKQKKVKVYMYANNHCIKKIKVFEGENIYENSYVIRVIGKKYMFGSNYVKLLVRPINMLKNLKGEIHTTIDFERGIDS